MKLYKIPELKWEDGNKISKAKSPFGKYFVSLESYLYRVYPPRENECLIACNDPEAAKAAAQSHYEAKMAEGLEEVGPKFVHVGNLETLAEKWTDKGRELAQSLEGGKG